jgi:phage gp36-like protein
MPYVTRQQVEDKIPPPVLLDALDDDGDGQEDSGRFDSIVATASQEVEGYLAGLYTVPFSDPAPAKARAAAFAFTCELIYNRRESRIPDWLAEQLKFWRSHLEKVANREVPFDAAVDKAFVPGAAITEHNSVNAQAT